MLVKSGEQNFVGWFSVRRLLILVLVGFLRRRRHVRRRWLRRALRLRRR